ncbi:MAG: MFS transporter [Nocardiopsaceae bacterium]|jgi:EmrB/QacA subfamily drug resistance transporter|nr:MFS transporter [Nocardiopsaceae bacterium]
MTTAGTAATSVPAGIRDETRPARGALPVLLTGVFMTLLDFFIVNVALPDTQRDLHAGTSAVQFIVAGYGLALAAGLITAGRLGDLYGKRRMYVLGLGLFTLASAACGLAPSAGVLIAARVVQGAGAAMLMPQILGIISTLYTGAQRARAFTAYGMAIGFGAVFGQLIGGVLIRLDPAGLGWRSIFLINVPVGVAAVAMALRLVPETRAPRAARLDLIGTVLVSLGLVAIVLPLVEGQQQGWPAWTFGCLAASVPLLGGFGLYQRRLAARAGSPLISPALLRERAVSAGTVTTITYQMIMASFFLVLALYLQDGRGLSALESGLIFLPLGLGYFAASLRSRRAAARLGRQVLALGSVVVSAGYLLLAVAAHDGIGWLVPGLVISGIGMGLVTPVLPAIVLARVTPEHASTSSGVLSTGMQAGNAIGVAVIGAVFYHALGGGSYPHAFALGLEVMAALGLAVAAVAQLLPRTP